MTPAAFLSPVLCGRTHFSPTVHITRWKSSPVIARRFVVKKKARLLNGAAGLFAQEASDAKANEKGDASATLIIDHDDVGTEKREVHQEEATDSNGNKGGGHDVNDGSGDGRGGDDDDEDKPVVAEVSEKVKEKAGYNWRKLLVGLKALIHHVPAQVLVAIISIISTISGTQYKRKIDKEKEHKKRVEEEQERREKLQDQLHGLFQDFTGPLLRSGGKLADRLYTLVKFPDEAFENDADPLYTAYVIGRYFAVIEMLKLESPNLSFGFPAADRIFLNIVGRIQGVWAASDATLRRLQSTERSFKPPNENTIIQGGRLQITPYAQSVCGDLMLRVRWNGVVPVKGDDSEESEAHRGMKAMISFLEFSELMRRDNSMSKWFLPIVKDVAAINRTRKTHKSKDMKDIVGARMFVLQSALCDLVEFLDPSPRCRFVPRYRRNRLSLAKDDSIESQRTPDSLLTIYRQMQNIRDQVVEKGKFAKYKTPLEVYVKGPFQRDHTYFDSGENGDCPFSQRVLIMLEEMGVPYRKVPIYPEKKPTWFPLLNAEGQVPVVFHEGKLIEDSRQIIGYLVDQFPKKAKKISSTDKLHLTGGTGAFTKFYGVFQSWLSGVPEVTEERVHTELRRLNDAILVAQEKQKGPFFGGLKFSRIDTAVAPFLHHVAVAGPKLKQMKTIYQYPGLKRYLEACFQMPSFKKTRSTEESILKGYSRLLTDGPERRVRLPDLIE